MPFRRDDAAGDAGTTGVRYAVMVADLVFSVFNAGCSIDGAGLSDYSLAVIATDGVSAASAGFRWDHIFCRNAQALLLSLAVAWRRLAALLAILRLNLGHRWLQHLGLVPGSRAYSRSVRDRAARWNRRFWMGCAPGRCW